MIEVNKILEAYRFHRAGGRLTADLSLAWDVDTGNSRDVIYYCLRDYNGGFSSTNWIAVPDRPGWKHARPPEASVKDRRYFWLTNDYDYRSERALQISRLLQAIHEIHLSDEEQKDYTGCCVPYIILWPQYRSPEGVVLYRVFYAVHQYIFRIKRDSNLNTLVYLVPDYVDSNFYHSIYSSSEQRAFKYAIQQVGWSFSDSERILSRIGKKIYHDFDLARYSHTGYCMRPVQVVCRELSPIAKYTFYQQLLLVSFFDIWRSYEEQYPNECLLHEMSS